MVGGLSNVDKLKEIRCVVIEGKMKITTVKDGTVEIPDGYYCLVEWGTRGEFVQVIQMGPKSDE
jgi:hypothetical protein